MNRRELLGSGAILSAAWVVQALNPWANAIAAAPAGGPVKVGMVGTAHSHAAGKMESLRKQPEFFEVIGVVEADDSRRAAAAKQKEYADLPWMTEEQLLNRPGLQAVLVETGVAEQAATAARCAAAGMHIHLEKPGGPSHPALAGAVERCRQKSLVLQLGYMLRGNPAFELCRRVVREGWLGEIFEINAVMGKIASAGERQDMRPFSGGIMFELGGHIIDPMVKLLGKPQRVTPSLRKMRLESDDLADNTLAMCEYASALCTVRSCGLDVEGGRRRQFIVCGSAGALAIVPLEPPQVLLTLASPRGEYKRGSQQVALPKMTGRYDAQLADFARIVRGEQPQEFGYDHELAVHETLLRCSAMPLE